MCSVFCADGSHSSMFFPTASCEVIKCATYAITLIQWPRDCAKLESQHETASVTYFSLVVLCISAWVYPLGIDWIVMSCCYITAALKGGTEK